MKLVGITACPTGIAHTYMAAEALEEAAAELGYNIKVETQGSMGIENELTEAEIASADAIILAVDMSISGEDRFWGKPVLKCGVSEAIKNPTALILQAVKLVEKEGDDLEENFSGDNPHEEKKEKKRRLFGWLNQK
ncbi:MAG TPA: PTS fructose transporter subunit IIB [Firmicutes bacterium]|jgi:fructose-specific phosphotransferase system IIB component|nr:PTS fructose transporter subunit IIB [Bacillota bacterium]